MFAAHKVSHMAATYASVRVAFKAMPDNAQPLINLNAAIRGTVLHLSYRILLVCIFFVRHA